MRPFLPSIALTHLPQHLCWPSHLPELHANNAREQEFVPVHCAVFRSKNSHPARRVQGAEGAGQGHNGRGRAAAPAGRAGRGERPLHERPRALSARGVRLLPHAQVLPEGVAGGPHARRPRRAHPWRGRGARADLLQESVREGRYASPTTADADPDVFVQKCACASCGSL